jgi:hypothetical protein
MNVGRERGAEFRLVEEQIAVLRRQDRRDRHAGRRVRDDRLNGLALVRGERRDVDEPRDFRVGAGFGDDNAAVGMTDQHHRPLRLRDREPGGGHIVGQGGRRVLNDADVVTVLLQDVVDAFPAGAVDKAAVHEDDGWC